ncbi:MAG: methyltransferase domain-containing protein [Rhodospirillaceae bacterium]
MISTPFSPNIGFEDFRRFASDPALSKHEKVGFPDSYRQGYEDAIFADIRSKLTNLGVAGGRAMDIGAGCSDLPRQLMEFCAQAGQDIVLVDSAEMLSLLADAPNLSKIAGAFPDIEGFADRYRSSVDAILCYSVIQYVFLESSVFRFVDEALSLLVPGGQMLIGDVPNVSKRKRFFASDTGKRFHKEFMKTDRDPEVRFNQIELNYMDDSVVLALVQRARAQGFEAYILPQGPGLPMANRREDILITRP